MGMMEVASSSKVVLAYHLTSWLKFTAASG